MTAFIMLYCGGMIGQQLTVVRASDQWSKGGQFKSSLVGYTCPTHPPSNQMGTWHVAKIDSSNGYHTCSSDGKSGGITYEGLAMVLECTFSVGGNVLSVGFSEI